MNFTRATPKLRLSVQLNHDATIGVPEWVHALPDIADHDPEKLYILYVAPEQRDLVMGYFIESWDALEERLHHIFHRLVGTPFETTNTLLSGYNGTKPICDAIFALAQPVVEQGDLKTLENLLDRVRKMASKRNRIIHGRWEMLLNYETVEGPRGVVLRPTQGGWERIYQPISPAERNSLSTGNEQKIDAKYRFSLERLADEAHLTTVLVNDLNVFVEGAESLPPMRH